MADTNMIVHQVPGPAGLARSQSRGASTRQDPVQPLCGQTANIRFTAGVEMAGAGEDPDVDRAACPVVEARVPEPGS
ncbi:MAG TPA: hypothetical protein VG253_08965 [Streptosporangiaceae bacterium]|nr:hypothetical protein [Streptosporangiaceae bacterium]